MVTFLTYLQRLSLFVRDGKATLNLYLRSMKNRKHLNENDSVRLVRIVNV